MTMEFQWQNQPQRIQGTNEQAIQAASLESAVKELMQGSSMFAIYVQPLGKTTQQDVHPDMQQVLESFDDIFQEPKQLPPTRGSRSSHLILLKEGTEPINVRLYRYSYIQKAKIE